MANNEMENLISEIKSSNAILGTDLKLECGTAIINGKGYLCTDITYSTSKRESVSLVLTITTPDGKYVFLKKKGFGGLFGVSTEIQDFIDNIEKQTALSKTQQEEAERRAEAEREERERIAKLEAFMDSFTNDTYVLSDDAPDGYLLKKGEKVAVYEENVEFKQIRTHRVAVASGTSIRIAKGVSWRLGGAAPIERESLDHVDTGRLIITNQKLSFMGDNKSINIPIKKIVDVTVFSDAFEISKDGVLKKYIFMTDHGNIFGEAIKAMNRLNNQ